MGIILADRSASGPALAFPPSTCAAQDPPPHHHRDTLSIAEPIVIARAVSPAPRAAPPSSPSLVGNKRPQPHRFHLTTGRVLEGNLHRAPNARLADHLATVKGFISLTDAYCVETGDRFPYLVINQDHVMFIEEVVSAPEPAGAMLRSGSLAVLGS